LFFIDEGMIQCILKEFWLVNLAKKEMGLSINKMGWSDYSGDDSSKRAFFPALFSVTNETTVCVTI